MNTKSPADFRRYILGTNPTVDDLKLIGSRLPTKKQILLCFLANCQTSATKREAAKKTVDEAQKLFDRARIPAIQQHKMAEEVERYNKIFEGILKISVRYRSTGKPKERIDEFKKQLDTTFKFWPRNVMAKLSNAEDKLFLQSMLTDRKAFMGGVDKTLAVAEKKVMKRKAEELKRIEKKKKEECSSTFYDLSSDDESMSNDESEKDYSEKHTSMLSHRRNIKTGVNVHIAPDILRSPTVVQSLIRNKVLLQFLP